jgi:hypothetical protein
MDEIRRIDQQLFVRELFTPWRILLHIAVLAITFGMLSSGKLGGLPLPIIIFVATATTAYTSSVDKRFAGKRHRELWQACRERMVRFEEVLQSMRKEKIADLQEMPATMRRVCIALYVALRRADIIQTEVEKTEKEFAHKPPSWTPSGNDRQSQELYRIADKNIAEYRQQYAGVMAGVQRTEAQSAVFMTTVDSLRMKMLGYRLVGKHPDMQSHEFLEALAEAKLQLNAIDKALDELDMGHYPTMIAAMPPTPSVEQVQVRPEQ